MIWNALTSGYEKWYWYADDSHAWDGWYDEGSGEIAFETVHPDGLEPGSAVWFLSHANSQGGPAAFPGAVEEAATYTVTLIRGNYNLFNNPYPVAFKFNDLENIDWSNAISGGNFDTSDQIMIWDPTTSGYEKWYWYADSIRDLAIRFGYTEGKVKTLLFRTRARLRGYLDERGIAL